MLDTMTAPNPADNAPPPGGMQDNPSVSAMSTPQPKQGNREDGLINIHMAMDLMQTALTNLGAESEEGQIVLKSLGSLTKVFGGKRGNTEELGNTEILSMLNGMSGANGGSPELQALKAGPPIQGQGGATGGQPPGTPPGQPPQQPPMQ